ncbi:nucleoside/nucleotide kinase family protein [Streptomyces spongiae]|uniref:Uncharacterized protein n=1 Tax=Streptomyces spongiae TaxID=565072 RepID=A0A5N8XF51_9ACTN|nr:hypothetical protein [Streptomyces spongiae]MPY58092.1 hypothetical protein [Streptomyces spongiae]
MSARSGRSTATAAYADRPFYVLLGPDGAGKSSVLAEVAARLPGWRMLSTDDAFLGPGHELVGSLRRQVVEDVLPNLGTSYSVDFLASLLQTAVVHLRDQVERQDQDVPLLMDSYYYKILAKCRLAGVGQNPMYDWWRSFPQPRAVVYLDVSTASAWRRSAEGVRLNPLEHFGERPEWLGFDSYQKSLRKLMLEEVRDVPVTIIEEQPGVARTADAVLEVLTP